MEGRMTGNSSHFVSHTYASNTQSRVFGIGKDLAVQQVPSEAPCTAAHPAPQLITLTTGPTPVRQVEPRRAPRLRPPFPWTITVTLKRWANGRPFPSDADALRVIEQWQHDRATHGFRVFKRRPDHYFGHDGTWPEIMLVGTGNYQLTTTLEMVMALGNFVAIGLGQERFSFRCGGTQAHHEVQRVAPAVV